MSKQALSYAPIQSYSHSIPLGLASQNKNLMRPKSQQPYMYERRPEVSPNYLSPLSCYEMDSVSTPTRSDLRQTVGIDIANESFEASLGKEVSGTVPELQKSESFDNTEPGFEALIASIRARLVVRASGTRRPRRPRPRCVPWSPASTPATALRRRSGSVPDERRDAGGRVESGAKLPKGLSNRGALRLLRRHDAPSLS